jgi:hypothetical protein
MGDAKAKRGNMTQTINDIIQEFSDREQEGWSFDEKIEWLRGALAAAREYERQTIIEEYGAFNDGCGCCSSETLKATLKE